MTRRPKLVLKISPDLDSRGLEDIADAVSTVKGIDGVIVTNTTIQRPANLRNGPRFPRYLLLALLTLSPKQRTASNKVASPVRRYKPSLWKPFAACASTCPLRYPSSVVAVSHLAQTPSRLPVPAHRSSNSTPRLATMARALAAV